MPFIAGSGLGWCDVFSHPLGWGIVTEEGGSRERRLVERRFVDAGVIATRPVTIPEPMMETRAVNGFAITKGNESGTPFLIEFAGQRCITLPGLCFGVQSVGIHPISPTIVGVYVVTSPTQHYHLVYSMVTGLEPPQLGLHAGTSQGILDVLASGTIVWADQNRLTKIGGVTAQLPNIRGGVIFAQRVEDPPQLIAGDVGIVHTIREGLGFEPHLTITDSGAVVFCARTPEGAFYRVFAPMERLPAYVPPPPPIVIPPPPKDPDPMPEPVPDYSTLVASAISPAILDLLGRLNTTAEKIRAERGENDPATQEAERMVNQVKGACNEEIQRAINRHEGRTDWGGFRKDAGQHWTRSDGANLSTDIAFNKRLLVFADTMTDRFSTWEVKSKEDPNIQVEKWVAPLPGALVIPPADPVDPPPPSDLDKRVQMLEIAVGSLVAVVRNLNDNVSTLTGHLQTLTTTVNNLPQPGPQADYAIVYPTTPPRSGDSKVSVFSSNHSHDLTGLVEWLKLITIVKK